MHTYENMAVAEAPEQLTLGEKEVTNRFISSCCLKSEARREQEKLHY